MKDLKVDDEVFVTYRHPNVNKQDQVSFRKLKVTTVREEDPDWPFHSKVTIFEARDENDSLFCHVITNNTHSDSGFSWTEDNHPDYWWTVPSVMDNWTSFLRIWGPMGIRNENGFSAVSNKDQVQSEFELTYPDKKLVEEVAGKDRVWKIVNRK